RVRAQEPSHDPARAWPHVLAPVLVRVLEREQSRERAPAPAQATGQPRAPPQANSTTFSIYHVQGRALSAAATWPVPAPGAQRVIFCAMTVFAGRRRCPPQEPLPRDPAWATAPALRIAPASKIDKATARTAAQAMPTIARSASTTAKNGKTIAKIAATKCAIK